MFIDIPFWGKRLLTFCVIEFVVIHFNTWRVHVLFQVCLVEKTFLQYKHLWLSMRPCLSKWSLNLWRWKNLCPQISHVFTCFAELSTMWPFVAPKPTFGFQSCTTFAAKVFCRELFGSGRGRSYNRVVWNIADQRLVHVGQTYIYKMAINCQINWHCNDAHMPVIS